MVVVGSSGCGKTTLARALADHLNVPHVEVDALHWGPDWTPMPTAILRARVAEAIAGDGWVIDGNYFKIREMVWSRADTLVWLDYSMGLILWRILRRTLRRLRDARIPVAGKRRNLEAPVSFPRFHPDVGADKLAGIGANFRRFWPAGMASSADPSFPHAGRNGQLAGEFHRKLPKDAASN